MAKAQILVVEDDNIVVLELRDRLQSLGYAVSAVASFGEEAVEKAAETRPDLILMDIRLKGDIDGIEAAEEIRARSDIPVVYLTAYVDEDTLQRAKVTEPYGYIIKPFEERELHIAIEVALYKHKAEEALRESEKRFRELVENANDVIYTHDLEGNFTSVNPAATRIYGYTTEEVLQLNIAQIVCPEYLPLARQKIQEKLEGSPRIEPYELLTYSKEGEPIWVEVSTRLLGREGQPAEVQGIARDITERKRAEEALQRRTHQQKQLLETARHLTASLDFKEVLTQIGMGAKEILEAHGCAIYLLEPDGKTLTPVVAIEPPHEEAILATPLDVETSFTGQAVKVRHGLVFNDALTDVSGQQIPGTPVEEEERVIAVPFVADDKVLGAMCLNRIGTLFSEEDLALAETFATYATTALKNARAHDELQREMEERKRAEEELQRSFEKLQRTLEGTIHTLVSALRMRDPYTAGHQRRVTQLACAIANEIGLPEEQIEGISMAGLIHDLGKIKVPAEILSKPVGLNDLEYGLIKMHSQVGYDILKEIEFPWPVAQIVLQHHERMNGSGYPQGLSGEEIILEARILAVADVVEAMASRRPYRGPLGIDKALEEISQNRGVLYDPEVVDACLRLFTEKGFKFE